MVTTQQHHRRRDNLKHINDDRRRDLTTALEIDFIKAIY